MAKIVDKQIDQSVAGWFLTLRWGTVLCQVLLMAAVQLLFALAVPGLVVGLIAFEAASNLVIARLIRQQNRLPVQLFTGVMFLDVALLTGLLALTGGAMNPFTFLYLVHIVVGAILLSAPRAWALAAFASGCYGIFFLPAGFFAGPGLGAALCHPLEPAPELRLHLQGMWVAFVITAFFTVFFVTRIQMALLAHRETVGRLREEQFKNERLASLAALSAGAAHELATPLSTIAVAAGELYREMQQGASDLWLQDLRLIRAQVTRCRDILYQMAADAGEPLGEGLETLTVNDLLTEVRLAFDGPGQKRLVLDCGQLDVLITVPRRSIKRVLRGLVANAFHASDAGAAVTLRATVEDETIRFEVSDQGQGMDAATLQSAREPFFTTRPGQGLGLGLYLAATLAARLGGGLEIDSAPGRGTTVRFSVQRLKTPEGKEDSYGPP